MANQNTRTNNQKNTFLTKNKGDLNIKESEAWNLSMHVKH